MTDSAMPIGAQLRDAANQFAQVGISFPEVATENDVRQAAQTLVFRIEAILARARGEHPRVAPGPRRGA